MPRIDGEAGFPVDVYGMGIIGSSLEPQRGHAAGGGPRGGSGAPRLTSLENPKRPGARLAQAISQARETGGLRNGLRKL